MDHPTNSFFCRFSHDLHGIFGRVAGMNHHRQAQFPRKGKLSLKPVDLRLSLFRILNPVVIQANLSDCYDLVFLGQLADFSHHLLAVRSVLPVRLLLCLPVARRIKIPDFLRVNSHCRVDPVILMGQSKRTAAALDIGSDIDQMRNPCFSYTSQNFLPVLVKLLPIQMGVRLKNHSYSSFS